MTQLIPTEADRKAAASAISTYDESWSRHCDDIVAGRVDWYPYVQAFASHALAARREAATLLESQAATIAELEGALEDIGIFGCGMLNQPAALNGIEEAWLERRIASMEQVALAALAKTRRAG